MNALNLLKVLMWIIAGMHLVVGGGLNLLPGFAQFMADVYGAEVVWTPELAYITKLLGALMLVLGGLSVVAALNPTRHRAILFAVAILFLLRAGMRVVWFSEIQQAFGLSTNRNVANMAFFTFLAVAVIVLDRITQAQTVAAKNNAR